MAENHAAVVFELKGEIFPESVRLKDLGNLLENIERLLLPIIYREHPDLKKKENVLISLTEISKGSVKIPLQSAYIGALIAAYTFLALAIREHNYLSLPPTSINSLRELALISEKYHARGVLTSSDPKIPSIELPPASQIREELTIKGRTTLYGRVLRVGGKTKPTLMLECLDGSTVYCEITQSQARKWASRLYSMVMLKGLAVWDYYSRKILSFKIEELHPFGDKKPTETLKELSEKVGKYFEDIEDVIGFVSGLRNEDDL